MSQADPQNAVKRLMLLPTVAKDRFQKTEAENHQLSLIAEGQNMIIEDLASSIDDYDEITKKIENIDADIKDVSSMLDRSQAVLLEMLMNTPKSAAGSTGAVLSSVLLNVQQALFAAASEAAERGTTNVNLLHLIDVEEQVSKLIESMMERNMYPEAEDAQQQRIDMLSQHNRKIVQFLQMLKAIQEQQAQQTQQ